MPLAYIRGTPVCFTSQRIDGKRVTTYRGCGVFAILSEMLWQEDCEARAEERREKRDARLALESHYRSFAAELRSRYLANRRAVIDAVERLGFRYHRSSQFRLKKGTKMSDLSKIAGSGELAVNNEPPVEREPEIDFETFKRGDRKRYPTLKGFDEKFTWRLYDPELFAKARDHLLVLAAGSIAEFGSTALDRNNLEGFDLIINSTAIKATELAGSYPTPVVKLAAEAAALAWLEATTLEAAFMDRTNAIEWRDQDGVEVSDLDRKAADRLGRLADRAFRRFNQSMRLLADVQRATARVTVRSVARSNGVETVTATHAEIRP